MIHDSSLGETICDLVRHPYMHVGLEAYVISPHTLSVSLRTEPHGAFFKQIETTMEPLHVFF